jgi:T-complex protein 1 subunit zeta
MTPECLGEAGRVYEVTLGDDKFTFVEDCKFPKSCTIVVKGPNEHTIAQLKDAVRDGMRAVVNVCEDEAVVPGGGAWEVAAAAHLHAFANASVTGKAKLGVRAFADAMLIVPKVLAENSGFDVQETIIKLQEAWAAGGGGTANAVGLDTTTGAPMSPAALGVWDALRVKKQIIQVRAWQRRPPPLSAPLCSSAIALPPPPPHTHTHTSLAAGRRARGAAAAR